MSEKTCARCNDDCHAKAQRLERELAALCTGPFSDAKDCPAHRADVLQSENAAHRTVSPGVAADGYAAAPGLEDVHVDKLQPTPRTDSVLARCNPDHTSAILVDHARQLELELAAVTADRDMWLADDAKQNTALGRVIAERDALKSAITALTPEEARHCAEALRNGMNPAGGLYFAPGWNVLLDKLDALASHPYVSRKEPNG